MEKLHKQYRVCQEHFEESQFMNPAVKNRLIHTAVPTIIAVQNPLPLLTPKRQLPKRILPPSPPTHKQEIIAQPPEPTSSKCKKI